MISLIKRCDREPTESGEYLTFHNSDGVEIYNVNTWFVGRGHFSCETNKDIFITHWMPLPEPPKDE